MMRNLWKIGAVLAVGVLTACSDGRIAAPPAASGARFAHVASAATATSSSGATFNTDKDDYQPGDVLHLTGAGWPAGDTLDVVLDETPQTHAPTTWSIVVGDDGSFADASYVVQESDLGVTFNITATSRINGESVQATFTDGPGTTLQAGVVPWTKNGTTEGVCNSVGSYDDLDPQPGQQGWLFVMTKPFDNSGSTLTYTFSDGTTGTATGSYVANDQSNGGATYHYVVYAPIGAKLVSASATNGTVGLRSNGTTEVVSNLVVSHCEEGGGGGGELGNPDISKTAAGTYDTKFTWEITKSVDKTLVEQFGGTATFNYTVVVGMKSYAYQNVKVTGKIELSNPNVDANGNPVAIAISGVTDALSLANGASCSFPNGVPTQLTAASTFVDYVCTINGLPTDPITNTATVTWPDQTVGGKTLAAGSRSYTADVAFTENPIDETITVTDSYAGTLGTVTATVNTGANQTYTYSRTVTVPTWNCVVYDNTATFTTNDTGTQGSAEQSVKVCGPAKTGALTIGFWSNKNGQAIITGQAATGVCASATWLRQYAPFQDLSATATCAQVNTYVQNVIKAANASGASMNAMLKAQMLATALNVYFSDPALGGNKISAPAPIGGVSIDLTKICTDLTCTAFEDASGQFGGSPKTVLQMLAYAASQSNVGGTTWYGNVKLTQEYAKDAFDALNNQKVFAP